MLDTIQSGNKQSKIVKSEGNKNGNGKVQNVIVKLKPICGTDYNVDGAASMLNVVRSILRIFRDFFAAQIRNDPSFFDF